MRTIGEYLRLYFIIEAQYIKARMQYRADFIISSVGMFFSSLATLGIFIPAFVFVALTIRYWPQLKEKVGVQKFVRGVTIASLALMFSVSFFLIGDVLNGFILPVVCLVSFVLLKKYRVPSYYLIIGAIILGFRWSRAMLWATRCGPTCSIIITASIASASRWTATNGR